MYVWSGFENGGDRWRNGGGGGRQTKCWSHGGGGDGCWIVGGGAGAKVVIDANTGRSKGYGPMPIGVATPRKATGHQQQYSSQGKVEWLLSSSLCNDLSGLYDSGMAAGVMLPTSFDLVQEGQDHVSGNWVVIGILAGGAFIWLCKKFLEQYGEVSMLDIKGADANKVILVIGIMTFNSFGEGSGVGVSFAGSKGFSQGLLVTLAIAVHNNPKGGTASKNIGVDSTLSGTVDYS
ncbi:hypothetical protein IFM89_017101 [Coptis chinensis]|uniref:Uncharacterized protein n=1 Tax=Coptis chinensis TaxID=261450 RepID=A0A835MFB9_9MAGN|nr:hypothetical protein IFM89_017101 [Coptis chinensis]